MGFENSLVMRILTYLLIAFCFMSCKKENQENDLGPRFIDLVLINGEGLNLFNSDTENKIEIENIKNLFLINGEYVNQYHENQDWPKMCSIYDSEYSLGNIFRLNLCEYVNEDNQSTTVIDWGNGDLDTIVATMDPVTKHPYSEFWYNGISMNDITEKVFGDGNYYYEIKKDY